MPAGWSRPKLLYKYTCARNLESIVGSTLAFPGYLELNDPFESSIECAIEQLRLDFQSPPNKPEPIRINPSLRIIEPSTHNASERRLYNADAATYNKRLDEAFQYLEFCRDHLGILSLTADPRNVVMWAHYAQGGEGVCIGIDFNDDSITKYRPASWREAGHDTLFQVVQVNYRRDRPSYADLSAMGYVEKAFFTKFEPWSYEQEYRVLRPLGECKLNVKGVPLHQLPPKLIKEIILGIKAKPETVKLASELCSTFTHLRLMKTELVPKQYGLVPRPM